MVLFYPIKRICQHKVFHFIFAVIKDLRSPLRVLALSRVGVLIQRLAIKISKAVRIFREVCRYPVQNNTDFIFMQIINKIFKLGVP